MTLRKVHQRAVQMRYPNIRRRSHSEGLHQYSEGIYNDVTKGIRKLTPLPE